ncbi:unnamed protein product [Linum tenue]|uniref:Uncharacterized protein n=1 Tax=Linum tenue TaxID=586396 RepID=A0AAV0IEP8_9ROSI|nr:unnamed protein product [Linum tenue]
MEEEEESSPAKPATTWRDRISEFKAEFWLAYNAKAVSHWILLFLSSLAMLVAFPASSLLSRVYYSNGGTSKWVISWVAVAGWPLSALILLPTYNKLNASMINSIVVITAAMAIIALDSDSDRELVFVKLLGRRSFHVVLEQQVMVSFFGFLFTSIGVIANHDFGKMSSEAVKFKGGESAYILVLVFGVITFQAGILGGTAVLFLSNTVLAGVLNAIRVPLTSIAAVILLHDPMSGFKILSLVITFWGFCSYIYGSLSFSPKKEAIP